MNIIIIKAGRILFAIPIFVFGVFHFINAQGMAGVVPSFLPLGILWVYLTGLGLIAAAVSIIINVQTRLASILLAAMLLIFILAIHLPGMLSGDEMRKMMSMSGFLKDFAMGAGALVIAGLPAKTTGK